MSVGAEDIHEAICAAWTAADLDAAFRALWPDSIDSSRYPVLSDQEASPNQPFPYCVYELDRERVVERMTGAGSTKQEIRDVPLALNIHAMKVDGDARSAKQIAGDMADLVMRVFGGHPTVAPAALALTNGSHLITQYVSGWIARTELYRYQYVLNYLLRLDVPVAV